MDINEIINGLSNAERRDCDCDNNGFFGGNIIWIIILFALFGCGCGGAGGFGGFGGPGGFGGVGGYPGFGYDPGLYTCSVKCRKNKCGCGCGNVGGYGMLPYGQPGGAGCGGFNSWWWIIILIFFVCGCGRNNNCRCESRRRDDDVC